MGMERQKFSKSILIDILLKEFSIPLPGARKPERIKIDSKSSPKKVVRWFNQLSDSEQQALLDSEEGRWEGETVDQWATRLRVLRVVRRELKKGQGTYNS